MRECRIKGVEKRRDRRKGVDEKVEDRGKKRRRENIIDLLFGTFHPLKCLRSALVSSTGY